jgi:hypothetical protein
MFRHILGLYNLVHQRLASTAMMPLSDLYGREAAIYVQCLAAKDCRGRLMATCKLPAAKSSQIQK